jgi:hypothetical protein
MPFLDSGMASEVKTILVSSSSRGPVSGRPAAQRTSSRHTTAVSSSRVAPHIWKTQPLFTGAAKVEERIVCNLCPVVEIPKYVYSAPSRFEDESEAARACAGPGPVPFLLRNGRLCSLSPLAKNSALAAVLESGSAPSQEIFAEWLQDGRRSDWAIELLNRFLRRHAWKRGMRFDEFHRLFHFTRTKPKKLWWEMGGKLIQREVTAPHIKLNRLDNGEAAEFQCGWKHEAIQAAFIADGGLFLRLQPAWLLTELDGKTPSTDQRVGPATNRGPHEPLDQANERVLQTLRFWSGILAKGHRELRIETGANPIRVRLTPSGSFRQFSGEKPVAGGSTALPAGEVQLIPELLPLQS